LRRTAEEAEKTRERIFRAGLQVFSDRGYSATRLEDIARAAGTTRGAIYWHFKSKQAFFDEVHARVHKRVDQIIQGIRTGDAVTALSRTMGTVLEDFIGDSEWRLMLSLLIKTSWLDRVKLLRPQIEDWHLKQVADERVQQWMAQGDLRPVSDPALILQAVKAYMWGLMTLAIDGEADLDSSSVRELVDLLIRGMAAK
jgi:AcrR family transcriptional regulator